MMYLPTGLRPDEVRTPFHEALEVLDLEYASKPGPQFSERLLTRWLEQILKSHVSSVWTFRNVPRSQANYRRCFFTSFPKKLIISTNAPAT